MIQEEARSRLLAQVAGAPSLTRAQRRTRALGAAAVAVFAMLALFLAFGGVRPGGLRAGGIVERPLSLMLVTFAGAMAIAAAGGWALVSRGDSMLGRRAAQLAIAAVAVAALLLGWKLMVSSIFEGMTAPWPGRAGLRCLGLGLLLGPWPLAALFIARSHSDPVHPRVTGAALGVAAGAYAWALVDLWCPIAHIHHLLLGHLMPIAALAGLGAWVGVRWLGLKIGRSIPRSET